MSDVSIAHCLCFIWRFRTYRLNQRIRIPQSCQHREPNSRLRAWPRLLHLTLSPRAPSQATAAAGRSCTLALAARRSRTLSAFPSTWSLGLSRRLRRLRLQAPHQHHAPPHLRRLTRRGLTPRRTFASCWTSTALASVIWTLGSSSGSSISCCPTTRTASLRSQLSTLRGSSRHAPAHGHEYTR